VGARRDRQLEAADGQQRDGRRPGGAPRQPADQCDDQTPDVHMGALPQGGHDHERQHGDKDAHRHGGRCQPGEYRHGDQRQPEPQHPLHRRAHHDGEHARNEDGEGRRLHPLDASRPP